MAEEPAGKRAATAGVAGNQGGKRVSSTSTSFHPEMPLVPLTFSALEDARLARTPLLCDIYARVDGDSVAQESIKMSFVLRDPTRRSAGQLRAEYYRFGADAALAPPRELQRFVGMLARAPQDDALCLQVYAWRPVESESELRAHTEQ